VDRFLASHKGWEQIPIPEIPNVQSTTAINSAGSLCMTPALHGTDGFFAAVLQRVQGV
jgi:16S rRNA C967 or C1407 C5-methylase (RsmB/RsmF family)